MTIRAYTSVTIEANNRVSIDQTNRKPRGMTALSMLSRIEDVMHRRLEGPEGISQAVFWEALKVDAERICQKYLARTGRMGSLRRRLFKIHRKESAIRAAVARIENIPLPSSNGFPALQELPKVAFQHLLKYLPVTDIAAVSQLSTQSHHQAQTGLLQRAREYGYEGDIAGAPSFLDSMFKAVRQLGINHIPQDCIEYMSQANSLGTREIDAEATLRKIKLSYEVNPANCIAHFTRALVDVNQNNCVWTRCPTILKLLLTYGANPNARIVSVRRLSGRTPLLMALGDFHNSNDEKECIRLLLEHGADPNQTAGYEERSPLAVWGTPLLKAILDPRCIDSGILEMLIEYGANVNQQVLGRPVLHYALHFGYWGRGRNWKAVRILLANQANPFEVDQDNQTTPFQTLGFFTPDFSPPFRVVKSLVGRSKTIKNGLVSFF